jgi:hypothetical protein
MSEQLKAATIRSLYGAVLLGLASALAAFQTGRGELHRAEDTVLAFLVTFVGYMVFRGAAEGLIDSYRAAEGKVSKADVGQ